MRVRVFHYHKVIFLGLLINIIAQCTLGQTREIRIFPETDSSARLYKQEIDAWHERRISSLKREHGWLSLVALDWLKEGKNDVPSIGTINLQNANVEVQLLPNVNATLKGRPFTSGFIFTDADTAGPDKIEIGSRAFIIIQRGERYAIRMWNSDNETRRNFNGIDRFTVSRSWCIEARWQTYDKPKKIKVISVIPGITNESPAPGVAIFTINGKECRLEPIAEEGAQEYFFMFADKTNGKETYSGGRFLYTEAPKGNIIILDFNKAFNPPCVFTPYATCPLPPEGNRLEVNVEAGEKRYEDH